MGKRRIPFGWGVPLGCAVAMLVDSMADGVLLLWAWLGCGLITLCAPDTLRRASGRAMNDEMLGAMLRSAAVMLLPALVVGVWLEQFRMFIGAGLLLVWVNVNQSLMEARRDTLSLFLLDVLSTIAIVAALIVFPDLNGQSCLIASAGLAVLAAAFGFLPMRGKWKLSGEYFREIPLSVLRNLVWPVVGIGICWMDRVTYSFWEDSMMAKGFALGCVVMEVCRPMFRFSPMEGSKMRRMIPIAAMMVFMACFGLGLGFSCPHVDDIWVMMLPAMGCALCVFGPAQVRTFLAGILLILPGMRFLWTSFDAQMMYYGFMCITVILIAILITIPDWRMAVRLNRAKRMRRMGNR